MQSFCPGIAEKRAKTPLFHQLSSSALFDKIRENPVWGRNGQKDEMRVLSLINARFCGKSTFFLRKCFAKFKFEK
jgi:hypothetical protein